VPPAEFLDDFIDEQKLLAVGDGGLDGVEGHSAFCDRAIASVIMAFGQTNHHRSPS
jgi:hypothetical protein